MKNLFEAETRQEVLSRIEKLSAQSQRQWGEMTVDQMLYHINRPMAYALGDLKLEPAKVNWLFRLVARPITLGKSPFPKGVAQTAPDFKATGKYTIETEKKHFKELIEQYAKSRDKKDWPPSLMLGKFTGDDWARMDYKHIDHHFRQFGA
jgi:hypothetical protein